MDEAKKTGTSLLPRQSCNVAEVGDGALDVPVEVLGGSLLHVPNAGWHPVPQYVAVEPLQRRQ